MANKYADVPLNSTFTIPGWDGLVLRKQTHRPTSGPKAGEDVVIAFCLNVGVNSFGVGYDTQTNDTLLLIDGGEEPFRPLRDDDEIELIS